MGKHMSFDLDMVRCALGAPDLVPVIVFMSGEIPRRSLMGGSLLGLLAAGATGSVPAGTIDAPRRNPKPSTEPFYGAHQAGITTSAQGKLLFAAFDVRTHSRHELVSLLKEWTAAAVALTAGEAVGGGAGGLPELVPDDSGEALGLPGARLTLTIGFGPSLFAKTGLGLSSHRPAALVDLPHFAGDDLDIERSHGDMAIQACADDPQVALHAVRNLTRIAFTRASIRWVQAGFAQAALTTPQRHTPRNLFGFKDGTRNIANSPELFEENVWAGEGDGWMAGGSYLVARRIRMRVEAWDRTPLAEQEKIIGRSKIEGAPADAVAEHDPIVLEKMDPGAHVRLAHPASSGATRMLRRGYSYADGLDPLGNLNCGLFFLAYQRDPRTSFIPTQRNLAASDLLNEYIQHVGSGIWACPPGVRPGGWWGDTLLT
jgi:deferrochelatase/peroxidase EfeB